MWSCCESRAEGRGPRAGAACQQRSVTTMRRRVAPTNPSFPDSGCRHIRAMTHADSLQLSALSPQPSARVPQPSALPL